MRPEGIDTTFTVTGSLSSSMIITSSSEDSIEALSDSLILYPSKKNLLIPIPERIQSKKLYQITKSFSDLSKYINKESKMHMITQTLTLSFLS